MRLVQPIVLGLAVAVMAASPVMAQDKLPKNAPPTHGAAATADPSARAEPITAEDRVIARDIVHLYLPYDVYLDGLSSFLAVEPEVFMAQNPQIQALEKAYPGIVPMLMQRIGDLLKEESPKSYAGSVAVQAEVFAQEMTREELEQTRTFFQSEAGQAFLNLSLQVATLDEQQIGSFMKGIGRKGASTNFKPSDFYTVDDNALDNAMAQLPAPIQTEILSFLLSPLGQKTLDTMDKAEIAHMAFAKESMRKNEAKINALVLQVFEDYEKGMR